MCCGVSLQNDIPPYPSFLDILYILHWQRQKWKGNNYFFQFVVHWYSDWWLLLFIKKIYWIVCDLQTINCALCIFWYPLWFALALSSIWKVWSIQLNYIKVHHFNEYLCEYIKCIKKIYIHLHSIFLHDLWIISTLL